MDRFRNCSAGSLDLDIDSDNLSRLVSGLFPWSGSENAVAKLSELNLTTGSSDKTLTFSRAHIGSLASTPLSAVFKDKYRKVLSGFTIPFLINGVMGPTYLVPFIVGL